eukprot:g29408.t1
MFELLQRRLPAVIVLVDQLQHRQAMSTFDYHALGGNVERTSPSRVIAGLVGSVVAFVTGFAAQRHYHKPNVQAYDSKYEMHPPYWPRTGVEDVLVKPGGGAPVGGVVRFLLAGSTGPSCIFSYSPDTDYDEYSTRVHAGDYIFAMGMEEQEGWVYGVQYLPGKFTPGHARVTSNPNDIIRGQLMCWPHLMAATTFQDKLKAADAVRNYDPRYPTRGNIRRGVIDVVVRDGTHRKAYWYFEDIPGPQYVVATAKPLQAALHLLCFGKSPIVARIAETLKNRGWKVTQTQPTASAFASYAGVFQFNHDTPLPPEAFRGVTHVLDAMAFGEQSETGQDLPFEMHAATMAKIPTLQWVGVLSKPLDAVPKVGGQGYEAYSRTGKRLWPNEQAWLTWSEENNRQMKIFRVPHLDQAEFRDPNTPKKVAYYVRAELTKPTADRIVDIDLNIEPTI